MATENELRNHLAYICKKKKGYVSDLLRVVGSDVMARFETVGFITKGHTLKSETWRKTDLADNYFKEMYGWWAFVRLK